MLIEVSISTRFHPTNNRQSFNIHHFIIVKNPYLNFNLYTLQLNFREFFINAVIQILLIFPIWVK